ncbi:MAG: 3-hydroxyacyl-ACP dehydratase FabZ [Arachnia sp.]
MTTPLASVTYSADQLRELLPHRHPFVLLDKVEVAESGARGVGYKNITISDPVFAGHFSERAIYPGVLLVEAAGHTCGIVERGDDDALRSGAYGVLAGIRKFSFRKMVVPGDRVEFHVRRRAALGALFEYDCRLLVDTKTVAEGGIAIAMQEPQES